MLSLLSETLLRSSKQSGTSQRQKLRNITRHRVGARASLEAYKAGLLWLGIISAGRHVGRGNFEALKVFKWISC